MNRRFFIGALGAATTTLGMGRAKPDKPKYVFYLIGDGMGVAQKDIAERYLRLKYPKRKNGLAMNQAPVRAMTSTGEFAGGVTDSAAAGTALACGHKTLNGVIGLTEDKETPVRSLAFDAQDAGMKIGLVSSVPIDHATPAAFYARVPSRGMYYEIDEQLAQSDFDYLAGEPMLGRGKAKDRTPPEQLAAAAGYALVDSPEAFRKLGSGAGKTLVELKMGYAIDPASQPVPLAEMTRTGIELLDGEGGFFMMIEGGKIDWSGHANDLATNIHETLAFDDAVQVALDFYEKHKDETLVIVTADHETGGLQLLEERSLVPVIDAQKYPSGHYAGQVKQWKKMGNVSVDAAYGRLTDSFGFGEVDEATEKHLRAAIEDSLSDGTEEKRSPEIAKMYGSKNAAVTSCLHEVAARSGARWTNFSHSGVPVETTAWGRWADRFGGENDNTDLGIQLRELIVS